MRLGSRRVWCFRGSAVTHYEVHVNGKRVARFHHVRDETLAHRRALMRIRLERRKDRSANVVMVKDTIMEVPQGDVDRSKRAKKVAPRKTRSGGNRKPANKKRVGTAGVDRK